MLPVDLKTNLLLVAYLPYITFYFHIGAPFISQINYLHSNLCFRVCFWSRQTIFTASLWGLYPHLYFKFRTAGKREEGPPAHAWKRWNLSPRQDSWTWSSLPRYSHRYSAICRMTGWLNAVLIRAHLPKFIPEFNCLFFVITQCQIDYSV